MTLNFGEGESLSKDDLNENANDSDEGQEKFDESSDEEGDVSNNDDISQDQQDELGTTTNFLFWSYVTI